MNTESVLLLTWPLVSVSFPSSGGCGSCGKRQLHRRFPSPVGRCGFIAAFHRTSASIARLLSSAHARDSTLVSTSSRLGRSNKRSRRRAVDPGASARIRSSAAELFHRGSATVIESANVSLEAGDLILLDIHRPGRVTASRVRMISSNTLPPSGFGRLRRDSERHGQRRGRHGGPAMAPRIILFTTYPWQAFPERGAARSGAAAVTPEQFWSERARHLQPLTTAISGPLAPPRLLELRLDRRRSGVGRVCHDSGLRRPCRTTGRAGAIPTPSAGHPWHRRS